MNERLLDLLADQALVGLDADESDELGRLRGPEVDAFALELELAAAAIAIASVADGPLSRLPPHLADRIAAAAGSNGTSMMPIPTTQASPGVTPAFKQTVLMPERPATHRPPMPSGPPGQASPQTQQPSARPMYASAPPASDPRLAPVVPLRPAPSRSNVVAIAGWLAAAACLMIAAGAWYTRPKKEIVTVTIPAPPPARTAEPVPPTVAQERETLLARAGTARLDWSRTKDALAKAASGDVVWNAEEQRGFMRFQGLAKNDRRASTYQLWIFDKGRDAKFPVDGGVFDIDADTGDVIVPIKAKLPVGEVALFAITVEKPGGVVVSKREHIVVTAKPAT